MKKYNLLCIGAAFCYLFLAVFAYFTLQRGDNKKSGQYLTEINRVIKELETMDSFVRPKLDGMEWIKEVSFLEWEELSSQDKVRNFFAKTNGMDRRMELLWHQGRLCGLVRFDYVRERETGTSIGAVEGVIVLSGLILLAIMFLIRSKVLKPFQKLRNMPYELAKGHFGGELEENQSRFFGKFVWGISMLRDHLKTAQQKELRLQKEKKLLLLSISHDIKTPLNTIKLYAKALEEGIYETEEDRRRAAGQIAMLSLEIEDFVRKIVKNSSEDILHIEVETTEFYLKEYVDMIREVYEPKCQLHMTKLTIRCHENRLLSGNKDSAFEVMENIMENGLKYGDGKEICIDFYEEDYCQLIKVTNTGTPVLLDEMPRLFDSFYRGSNVGNQEGNGLGLYICREIMHKMDGDIFAEREKNGMSFILVFR